VYSFCQLGKVVFFGKCVRFCICVFIEYSCAFCFVLCFVCFMVGGDSLAPTNVLVRFRCRDGEVIYPFVHIFLKIFQFLHSFSSWL